MNTKKALKKFAPFGLIAVIPAVFLAAINIPGYILHASDEVRFDEDGNIFYVNSIDELTADTENDFSRNNSNEPSVFETKMASSLKDFKTDDWRLVLVNKDNPLKEDVDCELIDFDGFDVDVRIVNALSEMFDGAKEDNVRLLMASGYRDYNTQKYLYDKKVNYFKRLGYSDDEAVAIASMKVTEPLTSEHETGLAVDILSYSYNCMDSDFGEDEAGKWLSKHSYEYGFILRYPEGKEDITKIQYEPWHFRYVGKEAAEFIYVNNLTYEEFYDLISLNEEYEEQ
ncbi:MAG: M15 family metallopeptidase [Lachnospiraceae bacterium]|nr:M15 family metallopeptidase [Lachnospiraceae bacterium]